MTIQIYQGDCLEEMAKMPESSVDLILCDPPYGTTKGFLTPEGTIHGMAGEREWDTALDPAALFLSCERVLRANGTLILFSQEPYTARLITEARSTLPFSYRMAWVKDHFANGLIAKKAPLSLFEDLLVFRSKKGIAANHDFDGAHPLRPYAEKVRAFIGKTSKQLYEEMAHQGVCNFYRTDTTQFRLCTAQTYSELCERYGLREMPGFREFDDLKTEDRAFKASKEAERRAYLDSVYAKYPVVFNLPEGQKYRSNVLEFKKDYDGFHPTQKPVALLEELIATYSNTGDTVLDFTMGSGSTGVAAVNTGRKFIGIEKTPEHFATAKNRLYRVAAQPEERPDPWREAFDRALQAAAQKDAAE